MLSLTVFDLLAKNLKDRGAHVAVVDGPREATYAQLHAEVERLAGWLHRVGVKPGERVAIHVRKSLEEVVATLATARLGAVFVNLFRQFTLEQVQYVAGDCQPRVLITDARRARELAAEQGELFEHVLVLGKAPDHPRMTAWDALPGDAAVPEVHVIDADLAAILYTSGSTGKPKGVMVTHLNLVQGARSVARYLKITPDDRLLGLLAFCFDYGLNQLLTTCLIGGTLVLHAVIMPAEIVKTLIEKRVTGFAAVPPAWIDVVRYLEATPVELPALRYVTNSGGSIPTQVLEAMPRVFPGVEIYQMYGLTEAFRSTYVPPELFAQKRGAIGWPVPDVQTYIVDPELGVCGPGQQGELVHRGSLISRGYWGQPQATAEKIKPCPQLAHLIGDEPVCYSGDIVRIDEDGCYWFVSRRDSMIKCNSIRLSPSEVEEQLYQSGLVGSAVAFGVPDESLGQVVHAAITPRSPQDFKEELLAEFCKLHMPSYMIPRQFHLWPGEMPRTASGKIDRAAVVKEFNAR